VPKLKSCGVYNPEIVDEGLVDTYEDLPMLPGYVYFLRYSLVNC
jgi:hypothetical protein